MFFMRFVLEILSPVLVAIIIGLVLVISGRQVRRRAAEVKHWPETNGRILRSKIVDIKAKTRMIYQVTATYEYRVNGQIYQSQRIDPSDRWRAVNSRAIAEQEYRKYQPGQQVSVYYNPTQPEEAVLDRSDANVHFWMMLFGNLFLFGGLFFGCIVLSSALETCGIRFDSTHPLPGSPAWCRR